MPDNVDIQLNKIQHNINAVNLLTVQSDTLFNSFRGTVDSTNKKLDSLSSIVQDLSSKMQKLNNQSSEQSGFSAFMRGLNQTLYTSIGAVLGTPAGMSVQGAFAGQVVYEIVAGLGSLIDKAIYDATNSQPTDNTRKGDNSMVSYYDEQDKKIRFEKLQKLKYSDDWSNSQKFATNFIGRQIGYFNNQLGNSPKQPKTRRTKKRTSSKSQNNTYQNPLNDFVLQLQALITLIQQKFDEADFTKKLEEKTNITADALSNLSKEINTNSSDYETPGRRYSIPSDHYTAPRPRGKSALPDEKNEDDGKAVSKKDLKLNTKAFEAIFNKKNIGMMKVFDETIQGVGQNIGSFFTGLAQGNPDALIKFRNSLETFIYGYQLSY